MPETEINYSNNKTKTNLMMGPIHKDHSNTNHFMPGHQAFLARFDKGFSDGRNVVFGNIGAHGFVTENS